MPNFDTNKGPVNYRTNLTGLSVAGAVVTGGVVLGKVINNIKNDIRRKSLLEDLHLNDPLLRDIDKAQLMEWYATISLPRCPWTKTPYAKSFRASPASVASICKH